MNQYDFDKVTDRRGTSCLKHDFQLKRKGRDDLLPLWVADMEFALPDDILEDVIQRTRHGIFGYTEPDKGYFDAVTGWFKERHGFDIDPQWIDITPGVVFGIAAAIRAFTEPGDGIIIQQPVYYPFAETIRDTGRRIVNSQLKYESGSYSMDLEDFEKKAKDPGTKMFILCNPHNPVGRVWTKEELSKIADICIRNDIIVFSDEIHCDFIYEGHKYVPFSGLSQEIAKRTVTGTSASKTFNLAGLQVSNIITSDPDLKRRMRHSIDSMGYSQANTLGLTATKAAYAGGGRWHDELISYLEDNIGFMKSYISDNIPSVKMIVPEGTYLVWLDCKNVTDDHHELERLVTDEAGLWLDPGIIFGRETALFERVNIACQRSVLKEALDRLYKAFDQRKGR